MLLLRKDERTKSLYSLAAADGPSNGSNSSLFHNVAESATGLLPFDLALSTIRSRLKSYGYEVFDEQEFKALFNPLWDRLRNGLSFDWVLNHILAKLNAVYPYAGFTVFKGTAPFIEQHRQDPVFGLEIEAIETEVQNIIAEVFKDNDQTVFSRLAQDSQTNNFGQSLAWVNEARAENNYLLDEDVMMGMNYLMAFGLMLEHCVGFFKRKSWHDLMSNLNPSDLIVVGYKSNLFGFHKSEQTQKGEWFRLSKGLVQNFSSSRGLLEFTAFPDSFTFFLVKNESLTITDLFPLVSINGSAYMNPAQFFEADLEVELDKPVFIKAKYSSELVGEAQVLNFVSLENCIFKDREALAELELEDGDYVVETQIVVKSDRLKFKIVDPTGVWPSSIFLNEKAKINDVTWM